LVDSNGGNTPPAPSVYEIAFNLLLTVGSYCNVPIKGIFVLKSMLFWAAMKLMSSQESPQDAARPGTREYLNGPQTTNLS